MNGKKQESFSNWEIITLAVYLLGGELQAVDTEDIAVKSNELAPGRFAWQKYPDQINLENVHKRLCDVRTPEFGEYLTGSNKTGWLLTKNGVQFAKDLLAESDFSQFAKKTYSFKETQWLRSERVRLLASEAFQKAQNGNLNTVTRQEAEAFFRLDEYVTGETRKRKVLRIVNSFGNDEQLGEIINDLAAKIE